jgi:hypothetical protein
MARRRHRKNPIDLGIDQFSEKVLADSSQFCGTPVKSFLLTKDSFDFEEGNTNKKSILIKTGANCEKVLNNIAVVARIIDYVLSKPKAKAKYKGMDSLTVEFSRSGGRNMAAVFKVLDDSNPNAISAKLTIHQLTALRNKTEIGKMLREALRVKRLGLVTVPALVAKGLKQESINTFDEAILNGIVSWGDRPVTGDEILDQAEDSVGSAEKDANKAMSTGDAEDINEANSSIDSAIDDLNFGSKATDDPAVQGAIREETESLKRTQDELGRLVREMSQSLQSSPDKPKAQPEAKTTAKRWTFSQTDAGVTAVQGSAGAVKNVLNLLRSKLDYYAADEQLYGIDVTFKVAEKSSGSVSASRSGKLINIKVSGAPNISDLINAVATPLAKIYDEQDIDFDEDGFGLAQELEFA